MLDQYMLFDESNGMWNCIINNNVTFEGSKEECEEEMLENLQAYEERADYLYNIEMKRREREEER